ncbi:hypothetical protein CTI12_AA618620 [Artemisia annua]|uniref:Uncharacterized protein n=1 Tax=Artemisia annua TaxID=35608 RepID=A0A2U1KCI4_ARTAN|nr:hypothetical protein CTI12_AA618620 [Artemisia annua]
MSENQVTRRECNSTNNHDMMIPNVGTRNWIKSLNLSITDSNCEAWYANGQEAGYKTTYARDSSLAFVTLKGAGHTCSRVQA